MRGVLFKSKEKHLKQGEEISNLENAFANSYLFMPKGEDSTSRALMIPFLAIHAKKGEK